MSESEKDGIAKLIELAAKTAVEAYRKEEKIKEKNRYEEKKKETKRLLQNYRRIKTQIDKEVELTEEEKAEYRWKFVEDLMGNADDFVTKSEQVIISKEKIRQENLYALHRIDKAMELFKEECDLAGSEETKRRFRIANMYYISENFVDVKTIAELENVSEKTVYRDIGIVADILTIYIFGARI